MIFSRCHLYRVCSVAGFISMDGKWGFGPFNRSLQGNRLTGKIPEVIGLMQALAVL